MKTVFISGNFNILHPGHIRLFKFAKECGDKLIVGVMSDKLVHEKNYLNEADRIESINSISIVDQVVLINDSIKATLNKIKPNIVLKGKEHETLYNLEANIIKKFDGKLIFASGMSTLSSISLFNQELSIPQTKNLKLPKKFMSRHKINKDNLKKIIKKFSKLKVCIIGDLIVDEYIDCNPLGMSQEDPTLVVSPISSDKYIGGSAIVAAHAAGLGAEVHYISVSGNDKNMKYSKDKLQLFGVNCNIFIDESRPTTLKKRYRTENKTLLRVSDLRQHTISKTIQVKIFNKIKKISKKCDLLIFSDFNYGCLPQNLVNQIIKYSKKNSIMMVADSQSSSQTGNISRFKGMDIVIPTEREARISLRNNEDGLVVISDQILQESQSKYLILKLGSDGILIEDSNKKQIKKSNDWYTDRLEAFNSSPKDSAGAGDSLLVGSSLTLAVKGSIWESALIGSIMSSIQVSRIGNIPIKANELIKEFD